MIAGNVSGEMVPPMVVYKALNIYSSWCERGPKGALYSCSKSGWFDSYQFEKWFFELLLPILKRKVGKKMLIGDNLSSHISASVVEACRQHNIQFVCLPPNSTDKLQPLDVGVFGPLKSSWRTVLQAYKDKHPTQIGLPKTDFPRLLAETLDRADPGKNMAAAFNKCGLYPVNIDRAVERIPDREMECDDSIREILHSNLGEKLEQLRGDPSSQKKKPRGKKTKIPAGMSYTAVQEDEEEEETEDDPDEILQPSTSNSKKGDKKMEDKEEQSSQKNRNKYRYQQRFSMESESESDEAEELPNLDDSEEEEEQGKGEMDSEEETDGYMVGSFVVAVYDKKWYIAQVEGEDPEEECKGFTLLKYMERRGENQFVWGQVRDTLKTNNQDILLKVEPPIPVSSRLFGLPKNVVAEVEKLLRVKWWSITFFYLSCLLIKLMVTWIQIRVREVLVTEAKINYGTVFKSNRPLLTESEIKYKYHNLPCTLQ
jgi:hypothetical protein